MLLKTLKRGFKKLKSIIKKGFNSNKNKAVLPQIIYKKKKSSNNKLFHVSAFNYGNAGDVLLPLALQDTWERLDKSIDWINQAVHPKVDSVLVSKINKAKGVVIGHSCNQIQ